MGKLIVLGARDTPAGAVPVPVSDEVLGLDAAFEVTVKKADAAPAVMGWKVTLMLQDADGASGETQVLP